MNDSRVWALTPAMLAEVTSLAEKLDAAALRQTLSGSPLDYSVSDGVAVLSIDGILSKRQTWFSALFGGSAYLQIEAALSQAMADDAVKAVVLLVDSPGGEVDGAQALANSIRSFRSGSKPVVTVFDGMGASAAYWIGSAASECYVAGDTTMVGSIGVVITHQDTSKADAAKGVKYTEITAGRYKRAASSRAPLSDDGAEVLQGTVDHIYTVFVDAVAENRGVTSDVVLKRMADGKTFLGQQAVSAGLVDGVRSLGQVVANLKARKPLTTKATGVAVNKAKPHEARCLLHDPEIQKQAADAAHRERYAPPVWRPPVVTQSAKPKQLPSSSEQARNASHMVRLMATVGVKVSLGRALVLLEAKDSTVKPEPSIVADLAHLHRAEQLKLGKQVTSTQAVAVVAERFSAQQ